MWRRFDRFGYLVAELSSVAFLFAALAAVDGNVDDGAAKTLLFLGAVALWANMATLLTYYRRRLKQLAPEEM